MEKGRKNISAHTNGSGQSVVVVAQGEGKRVFWAVVVLALAILFLGISSNKATGFQHGSVERVR